MGLETVDLPDGSSLQALELSSRHHGSGLTRDALIGHWRLERIWGKGKVQPAEVASGTLRALSASLGIQPGEGRALRLSNSIALGLLKLCFTGSGQLEQRRPLLVFHFSQMQISLAGTTLLTLSLPKPAKGKDPFFALIASDQPNQGPRWLAARGRGGGLALWVRQEDADAP